MAMTKAQRSAAAKKGWETRRARQGAAPKQAKEPKPAAKRKPTPATQFDREAILREFRRGHSPQFSPPRQHDIRRALHRAVYEELNAARRAQQSRIELMESLQRREYEAKGKTREHLRERRYGVAREFQTVATGINAHERWLDSLDWRL